MGCAAQQQCHYTWFMGKNKCSVELTLVKLFSLKDALFKNCYYKNTNIKRVFGDINPTYCYVVVIFCRVIENLAQKAPPPSPCFLVSVQCVVTRALYTPIKLFMNILFYSFGIWLENLHNITNQPTSPSTRKKRVKTLFIFPIIWIIHA